MDRQVKDLEAVVKDQVRAVGQDLKQAGVTQDGHAHQNLAKNDPAEAQAAKKDLSVAQTGRHALTPCDGSAQAREAGQTLSNAEVKGGESQSAAKSFSNPAPTHTPAPQSQARGR